MDDSRHGDDLAESCVLEDHVLRLVETASERNVQRDIRRQHCRRPHGPRGNLLRRVQ